MTGRNVHRPLMFSIPEYDYLRDTLCESGSFEAGAIERRSFPDGETYQRIATDPNRRDAVLLGGTISDHATLCMYDLACTLVKHCVERLTLVIPYFGYATMDRAVKPGEVVVSKTRAQLFSSVPPAAHGNRVILLDLHTEGIQHYFEGSMTAVHVYARPLVKEAARRIGGAAGFVLGSTDAGRAKWVQSLANSLGVDAAFVFKRRLDAVTTEVTAVSAQVSGRHVIIYDDMIRTGGSLIGAGRAYRDAGASQLSVISTHGLFVGAALDKLQESGLFQNIICTDSHPRALTFRDRGVQVLSIAPLLAPLLV